MSPAAVGFIGKTTSGGIAKRGAKSACLPSGREGREAAYTQHMVTLPHRVSLSESDPATVDAAVGEAIALLQTPVDAYADGMDIWKKKQKRLTQLFGWGPVVDGIAARMTGGAFVEDRKLTVLLYEQLANGEAKPKDVRIFVEGACAKVKKVREASWRAVARNEEAFLKALEAALGAKAAPVRKLAAEQAQASSFKGLGPAVTAALAKEKAKSVRAPLEAVARRLMVADPEDGTSVSRADEEVATSTANQVASSWATMDFQGRVALLAESMARYPHTENAKWVVEQAGQDVFVSALLAEIPKAQGTAHKLLERVKDPNRMPPGSVVAPLHLAVVMNPWIAEKLLARGADWALPSQGSLTVTVPGSRGPSRWKDAQMTFAAGTTPAEVLVRTLQRLQSLRTLYAPYARRREEDDGARAIAALAQTQAHLKAAGAAVTLTEGDVPFDAAYVARQFGAFQLAVGESLSVPAPASLSDLPAIQQGESSPRRSPLAYWRALAQRSEALRSWADSQRHRGWYAGLVLAPTEWVEDEFLPSSARKAVAKGEVVWAIDADAWLLFDGQLHHVHPEGHTRLGPWAKCVNEMIVSCGGKAPDGMPQVPPEKPLKKSLQGLTFCLAGSFAPREVDEVECLLRNLGAVARKSVTEKTDVLIVGSRPEKKHTKKAEAFRTRLVDVEGLEAMLRGERPGAA